MEVLGGKMGEGLVRCLLEQTCFYFLGFLCLCQFWWKSIKKCGRESADRRIHRYTDRRKPVL